ncbi:MAG: hypothetical protein R2745_07655 [Vicinamibacterales bacterium]
MNTPSATAIPPKTVCSGPLDSSVHRRRRNRCSRDGVLNALGHHQHADQDEHGTADAHVRLRWTLFSHVEW